MVALPDSINWDYIEERIRRYNAQPSDDLLYRIGTHVDVLTLEDQDLIQRQQGGCLNPEQRYRVLDWVVSCQNTIELECDLALLIFGREQLTQWLEISRQAYPNFEFYLPFEYQEGSKTGWESGINFTMFWMPLPEAPVPDPECDFPWKVFWDSGELFWGNLPNGTKNNFDFTLSVYPNQPSFTIPGSMCEVGDYYTTPSEEEASLMSVAQVLQHFAVPA
jgi:hypothetical protein